MSERHSRASSLSLVSGLGTSSVSGTSESGHVNIEELDDEQLISAVHKLKDHMKAQRMETEIFESYYERLVSGNLSIGNTSSTQSRKTSGTQSSNMTPESDSIIQTPSLLDGQRGRLSRKKSSSRTSLASRHKSMKLSIEQRCGIARKELARIELELKEDRALSQQKIHNGNFVLEERSQRILELVKNIDRLEKVTVSVPMNCMENEEYLNLKNQSQKLLNDQMKHEKRYLEKMKTRNVVIRSKITKISSLIKMRQATLDEIGTVDRTQLYIENNKYIKELSDIEDELTLCRVELQELRLQMDKCLQNHSLLCKKKSDIIQSNQKLVASIQSLKKTIHLKKTECSKVNKEVKRLLTEKKALGGDPPNVNDLVFRYLMRERSQTNKSRMLRKKNLEKLSAMQKKKSHNDSKNESESYLYKGLTYDLYFCLPDKS